MRQQQAGQLGTWLAFVLYLSALLWLTLGAVPGVSGGAGCNLEPGRTIAACFSVGGFTFVWNVLGNIAAFVPLGAALRGGLLGRSWRLRWVLLAGAGLSLLIEGLQYRGGVRVADIDDVILNAAGALAGGVLWDILAFVWTASSGTGALQRVPGSAKG